MFRRDEEIFERLEDRSRKLVDSEHLDEGSRRGNEKGKEQKFLVDGDACVDREFLPITANIPDGLFISDSHSADSVGTIIESAYAYSRVGAQI